MTRDLSRLLRPKSIAVFGGVWAENVIVQCKRMKYKGNVWAVNPRRKTLGGIRCYKSVSELPRPPDAAFVGVNRQQTPNIIAELANINCGGAVCFASGFAEAGGAKLQQQLVSAAGNMPVLGPNCYGVINYLDGAPLWPDQHGGERAQSGVAFIGQSSNILINITSQKRGLPLAYIAAAGNQAQTDMAAIARGMLEDDRVRAVGFYIEGIACAREFTNMARFAESRGVFLAAIKSGKCPSSIAAAVSHTAALSGNSAVSSAFLRRCNVAEAQTIPELLETLKLFCCGGVKGRKVMSLSCSGGEAGHIADLAAGKNIQLPAPPTRQKNALKAHLGKLVRVANPLDYHTFIWHNEEALYNTYSAALQCQNDMTLLLLDYPRPDRCDISEWQPPLKAFMRAVSDTGARAAVVSSLPENMPEFIAQKLLAANIAPLCGFDEALTAIELAANVRENSVGKWNPLSPHTPAGLRFMTESEAKTLLQQNDVWCPPSRYAKNSRQAGEVAKVMAKNNANMRFAVKVMGLTHKTESGGVVLNIPAVKVASAAAKMPRGDGFLIEEMVVGGKNELIIGARQDAVYGASLTVGMGGVNAEVLKDTQTLLLPVTASEIRAAFMRLRLSPLLKGWRGDNGSDVAAAVSCAKKIAGLIQLHRNIASVEINPLIVRAPKKGAAAADALIEVETTGENS